MARKMCSKSRGDLRFSKFFAKKILRTFLCFFLPENAKIAMKALEFFSNFLYMARKMRSESRGDLRFPKFFAEKILRTFLYFFLPKYAKIAMKALESFHFQSRNR